MAEQILSQSPIRDPFEAAKEKSKATMLSQSPMAPQTPQQPLLGEQMFGEANRQGYADFASSELPQALDGLGIPSKGLALSEMGQVDFMNRLKGHFGDGFMQNPEALKLMSMFAQSLPSTDSVLQEQLSAADRTLGYLLGGK